MEILQLRLGKDREQAPVKRTEIINPFLLWGQQE